MAKKKYPHEHGDEATHKAHHTDPSGEYNRRNDDAGRDAAAEEAGEYVGDRTGDDRGNETAGEPNNDAEHKELTKLQELQKQYDTLNDKYLRLYSEFENFRRRTSKEKLEMMKSASDRLVRDLLPVLDDFDRAMAANNDIRDIDAVKEGFVLIHSKLFNILKSEGLRAMESLHQDFNTDHHDALTNVPAPKAELKGKVVDVAEKGYLMDDRVIRHAKVVVGQ